MILGLDISTSIIGVCVLKDEEIVLADYIDLRKAGDFFEKAQKTEEYLKNLCETHKIEHIFIEQALMFFRRNVKKRTNMAQWCYYTVAFR